MLASQGSVQSLFFFGLSRSSAQRLRAPDDLAWVDLEVLV
jgi:hypothetical protein